MSIHFDVFFELMEIILSITFLCLSFQKVVNIFRLLLRRAERFQNLILINNVFPLIFQLPPLKSVVKLCSKADTTLKVILSMRMKINESRENNLNVLIFWDGIF
jgi:hypothetical protein